MNSEIGQFDAAAYAAQVVSDTDLFAAAVAIGPLDAAVAACPGWDLEQLVRHMGYVHRWAQYCALHGERPASTTIAEPNAGISNSDLATWLTNGATELADTLRTLDPDSPTWHPFLVPRVAGVWPRRQAHETLVHRWDAQHAVGVPTTPIDPALASDGIDEFFELALPRAVSRAAATLPTGSVHVHCTDIDGEWLVWYEGDEYHMVRAHQKGDAALRGPAEQLLLALYGRDGDRSELNPVGDEAVLEAWFALPGL